MKANRVGRTERPRKQWSPQSSGKPRGGSQRLASPVRLQTCSKGLMSAILSKLATYEELQSSTQYGYYRGGYFRLAKTEPTPSPEKPVQPSFAPPLSSWLEGTFPSTLGSDHWLSPKIEIQTKFMFAQEGELCDAETQAVRDTAPRRRTANVRCRECAKLDERRSLLSTKARSNFTPYPMHAPKLLGFTGPLLSTRPKTAAVRPSSHNPSKRCPVFRRVSPSIRPKNPDSVTCIDVLIPTPKFRPSPVAFNTEETDRDEGNGKHLKAFSMGDNPLRVSWAEKYDKNPGIVGRSFSKRENSEKLGERPDPGSVDLSLYSNIH